MRMIKTDGGTGVLIADAVTSLAFPPVTSGDVSSWNTTPHIDGITPEFDLEIWAAAAVNLTAAELYGAVPHSITIADVTLDSVTNATETLTKTSHGLLTGDGPIRLTTTDTLPAGLALNTNYWAVKVDGDNFKLAASRADALAATPVIVGFTDDGTGTHTVVDVPGSTERVHWHSHGLLGHAADGAIALAADKGYTVRCTHHPRAFAYAVSATFGGAVATTIYAFPVYSD